MSTLSLEAFWNWLVEHPNCVLRAGSPDALLCDDEDFHWWLGNDASTLVAQLIRGKRLIGEVAVDPERVAYVENRGEQEEGEHLFELISETESDRFAAYFFILSHGLEVEEEGSHTRAVH
ncbi:MAG TPA: hypothetical protein VNB06_21950 [Thermoanaerobaculia bacterium]|nr:hypothetical protein [Thermoanaerobaculia bacterium]